MRRQLRPLPLAPALQIPEESQEADREQQQREGQAEAKGVQVVTRRLPGRGLEGWTESGPGGPDAAMDLVDNRTPPGMEAKYGN